MMDDKPRLRPVEVFPVKSRRGDILCIRDATGLSDRVVTASPRALRILQVLDGKHNLLDIQAVLARSSGDIVFSDDIRKVLDVLDKALLLEGERFETWHAQLVESFSRSPVRKPASAGHAYPADPKELRAFLDGVLDEAAPHQSAAPAGLRGLIAPHIDYARGRKTYADAFDALARAGGADLFVILGTAHNDTAERFALTRKNFQTPLGDAVTDAGFVDELLRRSGRDLFRDEFAHRAEHSVELELVFLQHVCRKAKRDFKVVPILCGGFHRAMEKDVSPMELPGVAKVVEALRDMLAREKRDCVVIAGADLSHVGPRFGGSAPLTKAFLQNLAVADRATLAFVEKHDPGGFFDNISREENARNICGVAPIYLALKVLEPARVKRLRYEQWAEEDGSSAVTFAACVIF
jgi:hypothetical protein